jgi:hypothetical protein
MRWLLFVAVALGGIRAAAAAPTYPESDVDRPLLLYGGMTSLDLGLDLPTYVEATVDASGNATTSKTTLGDYLDGDFVVSHSFGSVEIGARILGNPSGPYAQARLLTYLGPVPGALSIDAEIKDPLRSSVIDHEYSEDIGYSYKAVVVPHQLALIAGANVNITELAFKPLAMSRPAGTDVFGGVGLTAEAQITPLFAIAAGAGVYFPIHQPPELGTSSTELETSMSLIYVLHHWDFYGQLGLGDITSSRMPFANIGAVHRWGG